MSKYRIAVLGLGGVGGFIGGKLASFYSQSGEVEIIFIARGENYRAIKENGLHLITSNGAEEIVHPHIVTDNADNIGVVDLIICCTKTYHLIESMTALKQCIGPSTTILPLLNGVNSTEKISALYPSVRVLHGCIYIVSQLTAYGTVKQRGEFHMIYFGGALPGSEATTIVEILSKAELNVTYEPDIIKRVWTKFSFISPIATYTSANNISVGKILQSEDDVNMLKALMAELVALAAIKGISLPTDTIDRNFETMGRLPYETTSSMHADFAANRLTEVDTLAGYVIKEAEENNLPLGTYNLMYALLKTRIN